MSMLDKNLPLWFWPLKWSRAGLGAWLEISRHLIWNQVKHSKSPYTLYTQWRILRWGTRLCFPHGEFRSERSKCFRFPDYTASDTAMAHAFSGTNKWITPLLMAMDEDALLLWFHFSRLKRVRPERSKVSGSSCSNGHVLKRKHILTLSDEVTFFFWSESLFATHFLYTAECSL